MPRSTVKPLPLENKQPSKVQPLPLNTGGEVQPLSLNTGGRVQPLPLNTGSEKQKHLPTRPNQELSFLTKHPNIHGLVGVAKEFSKISYLKYLHPEEREKFLKLTEQQQTRQLLFDDMEAVGMLGAGRILSGLGKISGAYLQKWLPKTYKAFTTPLGKGKPMTVAQKIQHYQQKKGKHPPKKIIEGWWEGAATKTKALRTKAPKAEKPIPVKRDTLITEKPDVKITDVMATPDEPLPKYAQSVNLERQNLSDTAKKLQVEMAGEKKFQSWDNTEKLGNEILADINKTNKVLKKASAWEGLNAAEVHVTRQVNVNAMDALGEMANDLRLGKISEEAFNTKFAGFRDSIFRVTSEGSGEIGRALNYHKKNLSANRMVKALSRLEKGMNERQIKAFASLDKGNPSKVAHFLDTLENPKLKDYVLEYWYNAILSGPPTHVVNIASNTAWLAYQVPHRSHVAFWDKIYSAFTGKARTRYFNELVPMMAGYKSGLKRGRGLSWQMMKTGKVTDFETKWAQEIGYSAVSAWERSPFAFARKVAPAVSFFTRGLRAIDVWANAIGYDAEINSIARGLSNKKGVTGLAREIFETNFKKNLPRWAHEKAGKSAKHGTFMDDPDPFTKWFLKVRKVPVLGPASQFVVPFVNTIGNLTKRGLELTPGVGIAKEAVSRGMGRGIGTPETTAKQIEGSLLSLYALYKLDKGDITGPVPSDPTRREAFYRQGKLPWAIKLGDSYYQYRRAEPYNTSIASVAIAYDKILNAKDDATKTEIFGEMTRGLIDNVLDSSYLAGLQTIFNRHEKFKTAPFRFGASFVPYSSFWRSMNRAYERTIEGSAKVRKQQGWLSAAAQVIPGLSGKIPAKLNVWGEEIVIPGSIFQHWLPYKWQKETDDPVEIGLKKLKIYPGLPSKQFTYKGKKNVFDDEIYKKLCISYGYRAKKFLGFKFKSPIWQKAINNEAKHKVLSGALDTHLSKIRVTERFRAIKEQRIKESNNGS